jgi:hypothetical protein
MAGRTVPVTVNFEPAQAEELRELAATEHRSLSKQVAHLVSLGLAVEYETEATE